GQPDLVAESSEQVAAAPPRPLREALHGDPAARAHQLIPRPDDFGGGSRRRLVEQPPQRGVDPENRAVQVLSSASRTGSLARSDMSSSSSCGARLVSSGSGLPSSRNTPAR
ncbi:MAG: hypothetical protein ACRDSN_12750, partial [Pseudonocardiaceae bacterium]